MDPILISAVISKAQPSSGPRVFTCEMCGDVIERNTWCCDDCAVKHASATRAAKLQAARDSVPEGYRGCRHTELISRGVPEVAIRVAQEALGDAFVMVLRGPAGSGKTSLACGLLNGAIDAGAALSSDKALVARAAGCRFVSALDITRSRQAHRLGQGDPPLVAAAMGATLLVLDELGSEPKTEDTYNIIHTRYAEQKPTIVTTWMTSDMVLGRYGNGMRRRLFEGRAVVIEFGGEGEQMRAAGGQGQ